MADIVEYGKTTSSPTQSARGSIRIQSPGWSGKVVHTGAENAEDREFQLDMTMRSSSEYWMWSANGEAHGGYVQANQGNDVIIGISLEHFGAYPDDSSDTNGGVQVKGRDSSGQNSVPAFGAKTTDNALIADDAWIWLKTVDSTYWDENQSPSVQEDYHSTDISLRWAGLRGNGNYRFADVPVSTYGNWAANSSVVIVTDLPIFATDADLLEYCNSGGLIIDKMLNKADPEEDYNIEATHWFIHNVIGHNTYNRSDYTESTHLAFYPQTGRICLYKKTPVSSAQPYDLGLLKYTGYEMMSAGAFDEFWRPYEGNVPTSFMSNSKKFASDDFYSVFAFQTNIPIFESFDDAIKYINYEIEIDQATNYKDIARETNAEIPPDFGVADDVTDIGTNGQSYGIAGFHLYGVSHTELSSFFLEIFDLAGVDDILNGTKLFSGNEINAIMSCMYLPISDLSQICEMGSLSKISVASWTADHSEGTRINSNGKLIDMGSVFIPDRYGDERCYEPYQTLVLQAPYCGFYTLQCAKYVGHTMTVKYAVSVADGSCRCLVFSDGILMDSFTGTMGTMRPISAVDQAQYISNVVNGIMSTGSSIASGLGKMSDTAMMTGGPTGAMVGMAGGVAATGIFKGYELLQAVDTPPMTTQGAITGCMGYFGPQKCHILVGQKNSVRPANERAVIGYPSGQGGKISTFSGFLKCSTVKLADGFTGSEAEKAEIMTILSQGIYL